MPCRRPRLPLQSIRNLISTFEIWERQCGSLFPPLASSELDGDTPGVVFAHEWYGTTAYSGDLVADRTKLEGLAIFILLEQLGRRIQSAQKLQIGGVKAFLECLVLLPGLFTFRAGARLVAHLKNRHIDFGESTEETKVLFVEICLQFQFDRSLDLAKFVSR